MINKKIALILAITMGVRGISGTTQESDIAPQIVSSFAQSSAISSTTLVRIQESAIENHKASLKSELFYKKITRISTKSLAAIALIYMLYSHMNPWFYKAEKSAVVAGIIPADTDAQLRGIWKIIDPDFFSWQSFKNNGKAIANYLVAGSVASAGSAVAADFQKAVFHPDSLEWFVQNKTNLFDLLPFQMDPRSLMNGFPVELQMHMVMLKNQDRIKKSTIEELREYLGALEAFDSISQENKTMSAYLIKSTCNSMVRSLELILGFMALKQEQVPETLATEIGSHINYLVHSINTFCTKLEAVLEDSTIDYLKKKQECTSALSSLKGELHRVCMRFVAIEREQHI